MSFAPLPNFQKLTERRTLLYENLIKNFQLDEIEAASLKKEFKRIIINPKFNLKMKAVAHHELACIYAYSLNLDLAISHIDTAKRLGLEEAGVLISKCLFYNLNGELSAARKLLENWNFEQNTPSMDVSILSHAAEVGMFDIAKRISFKPILNYKYYEAAAEVLASIEASSLSVTERLELAAKTVIEETRKPFIAYNLFAMKGEGILYEIVVDETLDELLRIDEKINEKLLEKYGFDELAEWLSISIMPYVEGAALPINNNYHARIS